MNKIIPFDPLEGLDNPEEAAGFAQACLELDLEAGRADMEALRIGLSCIAEANGITKAELAKKAGSAADACITF